MSAPDASLIRTIPDTLFTFFALYFTTLFSLDTWDAARGSQFRAPGGNTYFRPANPAPSSNSYQGGMFNSNRNGSGGSGGNGGRDVGRIPTARDSRPPMRMGGTAGCGACMI